MIDTIMALWNRGKGGRGLVALLAFVLFCICISLLLVTTVSAWSALLHGKHQHTAAAQRTGISYQTPTGTQSGHTGISTPPQTPTQTPTPPVCSVSPTMGVSHATTPTTIVRGHKQGPYNHPTPVPTRSKPTPGPTPPKTPTPTKGNNPTPTPSPTSVPTSTPTIPLFPRQRRLLLPEAPPVPQLIHRRQEGQAQLEVNHLCQEVGEQGLEARPLITVWEIV